MSEYELRAIHDGRKSFYKKAYVIENEGVTELRSYQTIVCRIENNKPIVTNTYSDTTLRHIKEFLRQMGFDAFNKSQILKDYAKSKEQEQQEQTEQENKTKGLMDSIKMVCAFNKLTSKSKKEENAFRVRMFKAGLESRGLSFPEDWETLSEVEKEKRLDLAQEQFN